MDGKERELSAAEIKWVSDKVSARMPVMAGEELLWALGAPMPKSFKAPGEWVKTLILCMFVGNHKVEVEPDLGSIAANVAGVYDGLLTTASALANSPGEYEGEGKKRASEQKRLREDFGKLLKSLQEKFQPPSIADLRSRVIKTGNDSKAYFESSEKGSEFVMKKEKKEDAITAEIHCWMWICWKEAEAARSRPELYRWMNKEMRFVECDWKIFEKACRQIGYRSVKKRLGEN